jgi:hypothetical protein
MPLQATSGAASYDAFGGGVAAVPNYIEDVFSTWLYTGNGSTQTITNGIDLAGKGGLVWIKKRSDAGNNYLMDTVRGLNTGVSPPAAFSLISDRTSAQGTSAELTAFNSNGFTLGSSSVMNGSPDTYASWTFREQPKFFDVVTYTGDGATTRTINHNLASVPGCMIIKATSTTSDWWVTHRNNGTDAVYGSLNLTAAMNPYGDPMTRFATSTEFYPRLMDSSLNTNGVTYVAYLFAHNAGGFGLTGTDNVISCGSFTTDGSGAFSVTLGYEPQWVLVKESSMGGSWILMDTMRGMAQTSGEYLFANNANAASSSTSQVITPTATGFSSTNAIGLFNASSTAIYIAIRRGPMKVPTDGTKVFLPATTSNDSVALSTGFPVDLAFGADRSGSSDNFILVDRLRGSPSLRTASTSAETGIAGPKWANNTGFAPTAWGSSANTVWEMFRRAPGFMDVCCYTGTGSATTFAHNLGVVPELMFVKQRSGSTLWAIYDSFNGPTKFLQFANTASQAASLPWNDTAPTASVFSVGTPTPNWTNGAGLTYVSYLFATCPGVSKVGSYTGTGTTQTINCGFTTGARFVLIKRTDSSGDWYVWDTARGIVAGNDPYLLLNSTAAEVTNTDFIDTAATGFEISSTAPAAINASGGSFIFLAIA